MMTYLRTFGACCALLIGGQAFAACEFNIEVGDGLEYSIKEMVAESSCGEVTVNLTHTGQLPAIAMGHNWVLGKTEEYQAIANEGMMLGEENSYLKPDDPRVIAYSKIVGGGESTSVTFSVSGMAPGDYTFFCSFPGHWSTMNGVFRLS